MVYESSFLSITAPGLKSNLSKKLARKPGIGIELDSDGAQTYTTGSTVSGYAVFTSSYDLSFDEVQITLEGQSKVVLEQISQVAGHSTLESLHNFLKLNMPIPESAYPVPRAIESDTSVTVPFNFVIPAQLLPQACTHKCVADHVHAAHLQPPPSMGGEVSRNDFTPDMGRVHYFIAVKVLRKSSSTGATQVMATETKKIRVLPNVPEEAPLHVDAKDTEFQLVRTKKIRKGVFKGQLGELTFSTTQPPPFVLKPNSPSSQPQITAPLTLSFSPSSPNCQPPKIGTLTAKIKSSTFASVKAQRLLCKKIDHLTTFDPSRGVYTASTPMATMTIDSVAPWKWVTDAPSYARRDSGYETCAPDAAPLLSGPNESSSGHYEAQIAVPLTLPACKTWLPTFHSCLISRIYGLDFALSTHVNSSSLSTTFNLRVPVQIACSGGPSAAESSLATSDAMGIDELLRPRLLSVPDVQFLQRSSLPGVRSASMDAAAGADDDTAAPDADADLPPGYAGGLASYLRRESEAHALGLEVR